MKTCREILSVSIFLFLLCQHTVNADSQWNSLSEDLEKRANEIDQLIKSEATMEVEISEMTISLNAMLKTMSRDGDEDVEMTKEEVEHEKVDLGLTLKKLKALEEETQTIANKLPGKVRELRATNRRAVADVVTFLKDYDNAICSEFLVPAQEELDDDSDELCEHAADAERLEAMWVLTRSELGTVRSRLDENVKEREVLVMMLRKTQEDQQTTREEMFKLKQQLNQYRGGMDQLQAALMRITLNQKDEQINELENEEEYISNKLEAKEAKVQTIEKKAKELQTAFRKWAAADIGIRELEDADRMELLRRAHKELDHALKPYRKQKLEENETEKTILEEEEAEAKEAVDAAEAEDADLESNQEKLLELEGNEAALEQDVDEQSGLF